MALRPLAPRRDGDSFSGCSFDFDRERALKPGDVGGRALREASAPAPYARAHIGGAGRE